MPPPIKPNNEADVSPIGTRGIGLALSGGGYRAMFFHLGVIRFLAQSGLLREVKSITAVSGGSVLAAWLLLHWEEFLDCDSVKSTPKKGQRLLQSSCAFDEAAAPLIQLGMWDMRGTIQRRMFWDYCAGLPSRVLRPRSRAVFERTTSGRMERYLRARLFGDKTLEDLAGTNGGRPRLMLLATGLNDFSLCAFESGGTFHYDLGKADSAQFPSTPVALAVTASAAFPTFFAPVPFDHSTVPALPKAKGTGVTCRSLGDGGIYDNIGLRALCAVDDGRALLLVSDASAAPRWQETRSTFRTLRNTIRATDILMKRVHEMECEVWQERDIGRRLLVLDIDEDRPIKLGTRVGRIPPTRHSGEVSIEARRQLRYLRTDFDAFTSLEARALIQFGFCVARDALSASSLSSAEVGVRKTAGETAWDPFRKPLPSKPGAVTSSLGDGSRRSLRIVAPRDAHSWLTVTMLFLALVGTVFSTFAVTVLVNALIRDEHHVRMNPTNLSMSMGRDTPPRPITWEDFAASPVLKKLLLPPDKGEITGAIVPIIESRIAELTAALWQRNVNLGTGPFGFLSQVTDAAPATLSTATATAALAMSDRMSRVEPRTDAAARVAEAVTRLRSRFPPPLGTLSPGVAGSDAVVDPSENLLGWRSVNSRRQPHAGTLLWMLVAITVVEESTSLLTDSAAPEQDVREKWLELWNKVWTLAQSYRGGSRDGSSPSDGCWTMFPGENSSSNPFAASLAIHMLLELGSRPVLEVTPVQFNMAVSTARELEQCACVTNRSVGWTARGCPECVGVSTLPALSLQVISALLRLEYELSTSSVAPSYVPNSSVQDLMREFARTAPLTAPVDDQARYKSPTSQAEPIVVTHLYRPWEILCRWYFVRRLMLHDENAFPIRAAILNLKASIELARTASVGKLDSTLSCTMSEELYVLNQIRRDLEDPRLWKAVERR